MTAIQRIKNHFLGFLWLGFWIFFVFGVSPAVAGLADHYRPEDQAQEMLLEVTANKEEAYVDEAVVLTYTLLTRLDTQYKGVAKEERDSGSWSQEIPVVPSEVSRVKVKRAEREYLQAPVRKKIFFAKEPGVFKIVPADLKMSVGGKKSYFSSEAKRSDFLLSGPDVKIEILDFPSPPDGFSGSSGKYRLSTALENPQPQDGIYLFNVTVVGEGNLWNVKLPPMELEEDFQLISVKEIVRDKGSWKEETVSGEKIFRYKLIPKRAGTLTFPAVSFVSFNPEKKDYETAVSESVTIHLEAVKSHASPPPKADSGFVVISDRSASMQTRDFGKESRLDISKKMSGELLKVSSAQWFDLILFAADLEEKSGLSQNRSELIALIQSHKKMKQEGTAMGDAVYTALKAFEQSVKPSGRKQILLIGDGVNNAGHLTLLEAAKMAAQEKTVIYSLALGQNGKAPFPVEDPVLGKHYVQVIAEVKSEDLEEAARLTGGKFFRIQNAAEAESAMKELRGILEK